jgi:hypothetical protein
MEVKLSAFAEKVNRYYNHGNGLWSIDRVQKALELGKITKDEYEKIVG